MKLCVFFLFAFATNVTYGQWAEAQRYPKRRSMNVDYGINVNYYYSSNRPMTDLFVTISRIFLEDVVKYFDSVMQESVLQLEQRGFSNLKLNDITQSISQQMYKWHVIGNVTYSNGFLVSIQKMEVTDVAQLPSSITVDGVAQTTATIHGKLNLRDMKIGYDVHAKLGEDGDHTFTGTFVHPLARLHFYITKNLNTNVITGSSTLDSLTSDSHRMDYMPANNITQVISRTYTPSNIYDSVENWGRDIFLPIILDVVRNKLEFPPVCLDCR